MPTTYRIEIDYDIFKKVCDKYIFDLHELYTKNISLDYIEINIDYDKKASELIANFWEELKINSKINPPAEEM